MKPNYCALRRAAPQQTFINDGDYMTDEKTQQPLGVASDLNAELGILLTRQVVHAKDEILKKAITSRLGEEWTIEQLKGRCYTTKSPNTDEVFYLDGMPLIAFGEPTFETIDAEIKAKINCRLFNA